MLVPKLGLRFLSNFLKYWDFNLKDTLLQGIQIIEIWNITYVLYSAYASINIPLSRDLQEVETFGVGDSQLGNLA